MKSADSYDDWIDGLHRLRFTRRAYLAHGVCCDAVTVGLMLLHWQDRNWLDRRVMMSPQTLNVTDSVGQWSANGTSGSFSAAANGSSYCASAQIDTIG